ncbi:MAG TPA: hypothetical protein VIU41_10360 [Geobacteraceae bacterium]
MKRIVYVIIAMAASLLFSAVATLRAENYPEPFGKYGTGIQSNQKNECLLVAMNCAPESGFVHQRVFDLRSEIAKGLTIYTPEELNMLKEQLKWIETDNADATS